MKHVPVMHLKTALHGAAVRQLSSVDHVVVTNPSDVRVVFKGREAKAVWANDTVKRQDGRGVVTTKTRVTATIVFPDIPDVGSISRGEADRFAGTSLHEQGHVLYTDRDARSRMRWKHQFAFDLVNGFEDPRIENQVVKHRVAPGAQGLFNVVANALMNHAWLNGYDPNKVEDAPFTAAILGRVRLGASIRNSDVIWQRLTAKNKEFFAIGLDALEKARDGTAGTNDICAAVDRMMDWLASQQPQGQQQEQQPQQQPQQQPKQQPQRPLQHDEQWWGDETQDERAPEEQDDEGEDFDAAPQESEALSPEEENIPTDHLLPDSQEDEGDDDQDGNDLGDKGGAGEPLEGDDQNEGQDEGQDGEGQGEGQDGDDQDGDDQGEGEGESDDDQGEGQGEGDDDQGEEGSEQDADDASKGGDGYGKDFIEQAATVKPEEVRTGDVAESIERLSAKLRKRDTIKGEKQLPSSAAACVSDVKGQNLDRLKEERYESIRALAGPKGAIAPHLQRLIYSPERGGWDRSQPDGRWDRKAATKLLSGYENVFKKRWESPGTETAITLLVDFSGSMAGSYSGGASPIDCANALAITLAEVIEQCPGASLEVCGFSTEGTHGGQHVGERDQRGTYADIPDDKFPAAGIHVIKPRNEKVRQRRLELGNMASFVGGGTPDYSAVLHCVKSLILGGAKRKVLFVLTDGVGAGAEHIGKVVSSAKRLGVDVIGVGIQQDVSDQYELSINVVNPRDLTGKALGLLVRQFEKYEPTRQL